MPAASSAVAVHRNGTAPAAVGPDGRLAPLALAADDALRESVRDWYRRTFGVRIDVAAHGKYFELVTGTPLRDDDVRLGQSGRGLSHVLPVAVTALSARGAGPGVDVIEHPEAELHPARLQREGTASGVRIVIDLGAANESDVPIAETGPAARPDRPRD